MRRRRAPVAMAAMVLAACGGGERDAQPDPIEVARQQAEAAAGAAPVAGTTVVDAPRELPPPDPALFVGRNRVVDLWVGPDGATQDIDVWARRTFTEAPVLLAEGLAFAAASDYFAAPPGHRLVVVGAGAGPDGLELAGVPSADANEQITTIFTNDDEQGAARAASVVEVDAGGANAAPDPPGEGRGLVYLLAANTAAFETSLNQTIGGAAYFVGDGSGTCARQRIEEAGFAPTILGGTQDVQLELMPGPTRLTLHGSPSNEACDQPSVLDVDVDVVAGAATMVLVFSRDGTTVEALQLPMPLS